MITIVREMTAILITCLHLSIMVILFVLPKMLQSKKKMEWNIVTSFKVLKQNNFVPSTFQVKNKKNGNFYFAR